LEVNKHEEMNKVSEQYPQSGRAISTITIKTSHREDSASY